MVGLIGCLIGGNEEMIKACEIAEMNMEHVQFYIGQIGKDIPLEFHLSAGQDGSQVYLKFFIKVEDETFPYWIHPTDDWLKRFCQTCQVSIIGPSKNILANLNMPKEKLMEILSDIPQCKEWLEK